MNVRELKRILTRKGDQMITDCIRGEGKEHLVLVESGDVAPYYHYSSFDGQCVAQLSMLGMVQDLRVGKTATKDVFKIGSDDFWYCRFNGLGTSAATAGGERVRREIDDLYTSLKSFTLGSEYAASFMKWDYMRLWNRYNAWKGLAWPDDIIPGCDDGTLILKMANGCVWKCPPCPWKGTFKAVSKESLRFMFTGLNVNNCPSSFVFL